MMTQAFYTGISGLKSNQTAIDVIADNLSNTSTIGFRGYSTEFVNMFEEKVNTPSASSSVDSSIGVGVDISTVVMNENRGVFQLTGISTDLALLGDGWFGIQANQEQMYTRDGSFTFDQNRDLVTHDGYYVLGTIGGNINGELLTTQLSEVELGDVASQEKLTFPDSLLFQVVPTSYAEFSGNLGAEDVARVISAGLIDSQNNRNDLRLEFNKTVPQPATGIQWDVAATVTSLDGATTYDTQNGTMLFDAQGALISNTLTSINNNGTSVSIIAGTGYDGITSHNKPFSSSSETDGLEPGELLGYDINQNGEVVATFSNGIQSAVAKIAVYHFQNDRGLDRINGSRFTQSNNSGEPIFFQDETGKNITGTDMTNFKLEGSNVRMEVALTEIIVMQRAFDANSKSITTADEMLQKALSMDA
ncbi:MAG: flagellar hook-basal body complex protein [Sulfurimonas sp.]|nr:flagellar hook-basal body complex protein [Sulfurimonas sp.]